MLRTIGGGNATRRPRTGDPVMVNVAGWVGLFAGLLGALLVAWGVAA